MQKEFPFKEQSCETALLKMKCLFTSASHIICVYRIPGIQKHICEDYQDDRDHGCGRSILNWMKENEITCRAIFIVRKSNGLKIGARRFQLYSEAAISVIQAFPVNSINGPNQAALLHTAQVVTYSIAPLSY